MKEKYTDVELDEFKAILLKKKTRSMEQIKFWEEQLNSVAEKGRDESNVLQNAQEYSATEFTLNQLSRQKKHLTDIELALQRIERKTFGVCVITGRLIDKKRLLAVPTTTKSLSNGKKIS
jgi:RNA polymerase-binding protein DksA